MMELTGLQPLFINAGLCHTPTVPCLDMYGEIGGDPRVGPAVRHADALYKKGMLVGTFLSQRSDLLVLGECVPGGTTTALCVLRALGYSATVSSSFVENPVSKKEKICEAALFRIRENKISEPIDIVEYTGDPMMAVAAGIATTYSGDLILAGGTQMLAVAAILKSTGSTLPFVVTTTYVRNDRSANVENIAHQIGVKTYYVDPGFEDLGHPGLARYCIGEVKEGMGAGGAMCLAHLMGHSPEVIRNKILTTVNAYS